MVEAGEGLSAASYLRAVGDSPELPTAVRRLQLPDRSEVKASIVEFLLEGLHLNKRLNKDELDGKALYRR